MPKKRALIVDDSTTAQYRLKKMLKSYALEIDAVDSGEAALRYLASNVPDVVFMDHLMPGMDGFRALQIIKSHPETAMIPVIMYTSKSGDVYTGQARALGALDVVSKDTINATDLSKVMKAIHLYPDNGTATASAPSSESSEFVSAANQVSEHPIDDMVTDEDYPFIERRAPTQASQDQARNLELRLSNLEHSLEDNRRFITSRVVRELQALRQNIRKEFSDIIATSNSLTLAKPTATPAAPAESSEDTSPPRAANPYLLWLTLVLLGIVIFLVFNISNSISNSAAEQNKIAKQLAQLKNQTIEAEMTSPALKNLQVRQQAVEKQYADQSFLNDLTWAFNQSGSLAFQQNNLDSRAPIRAYEFIARLLNKGFRGTVSIDLFVGDFCLFIDPVGTAALAPNSSTLNSCMLSNEAYNLDRVRDNFLREMEDGLDNLRRDYADQLTIEINTYLGPELYPDRLPIVSAEEWNAIAARNNKMEISLTPKDNF